MRAESREWGRGIADCKDEDPRQAGKALQGAKLGNLWRYRIGDYRIICELQDQRLVVLVVKIGYRKQV
ncbi:type II toxin-antitoxin system RelE family toxin [Rhizobium sp. BK312]|uniref:type II toxin-antitoxin system RelE family toxin n=1 Tax=Rhizobium sp. BK312 TaxID=2587080 RepID=UPI0039182C52